ncbi:uncharacterized protein LOC121042403 isoform X2 [Herpailurus yagouaroundi]|uniref:uncharacterized protein LOC121042403 isoform X2 n=1 Tax=Herpailurus yagouaroundi TaxID=1608482 RepID=UPI001AD7BEBE|nr:uncharacterized protein LOC121042403 isoform X2 [Puma yagouaroundi]
MVRPADKFSRRDLPCCGGGRNTQAEGTRGERSGRAGKTVVWRGRATEKASCSACPLGSRLPLTARLLRWSFPIPSWNTKVSRSFARYSPAGASLLFSGTNLPSATVRRRACGWKGHIPESEDREQRSGSPGGRFRRLSCEV